MGLVARFLESHGIATAVTGWRGGIIRRTLPPRATYTNLERGATIGSPHNPEQQMRVIRATLDLLAQDAPIEPVKLDEVADE